MRSLLYLLVTRFEFATQMIALQKGFPIVLSDPDFSEVSWERPNGKAS